MVVSNRFSDRRALSPVFSIKKQPVPYVLFAIPGSKHACPIKAACWSPATPAMATGAPSQSAWVVP